jgi:hypothetical protein
VCDLADPQNTNLTILQPTFGAGYELRSKSEKWAILGGLSYGHEWNIRREGLEVGERSMGMLTFSIARRL